MTSARLWECKFSSGLDVGACSVQENVPIEIFNISFEGNRISNNMMLKLLHSRGEGELC